MNNEELTKKVMELDERVTRHTEQIKTAFNQIGELKVLSEGIHKMATSVEILAHEQKDVAHKVDGIVRDLDEIKEKPAKRWDGIVTLVITGVVSAVLAFLLAKFGL